MICDFCSAPHPVWRYGAYSFDDPLGIGRSVGDWMACDDCHQLIIRNRREALARRSIDHSRNPGVRALAGQRWAYSYARELHDRFFAAWNGQAFKIEKGAA